MLSVRIAPMALFPLLAVSGLVAKSCDAVKAGMLAQSATDVLFLPWNMTKRPVPATFAIKPSTVHSGIGRPEKTANTRMDQKAGG